MLAATPGHCWSSLRARLRINFSAFGVIELPGLAQHPTDGRMMLFRQAFHDVARLVDLAALDCSGRTEGAADHRQTNAAVRSCGRRLNSWVVDGDRVAGTSLARAPS